eukprot:2837277-Rhodomonas_salina.2
MRGDPWYWSRLCSYACGTAKRGTDIAYRGTSCYGGYAAAGRRYWPTLAPYHCPCGGSALPRTHPLCAPSPSLLSLSVPLPLHLPLPLPSRPLSLARSLPGAVSRRCRRRGAEGSAGGALRLCCQLP